MGGEDDLQSLNKLLFALFAKWNLFSEEQAWLLGIDPKSNSMAIVVATENMDRAEYLLSIHKHLRRLFPYDEAMRI